MDWVTGTCRNDFMQIIFVQYSCNTKIWEAERCTRAFDKLVRAVGLRISRSLTYVYKHEAGIMLLCSGIFF
jgi:hypothetical protein